MTALYNSENRPFMSWQGEKKSIRTIEANQKDNQWKLTGISDFSQVLWMAHAHLPFPAAVTLSKLRIVNGSGGALFCTICTFYYVSTLLNMSYDVFLKTTSSYKLNTHIR